MLYFDTDVIVHYIVVQDAKKQQIAKKTIKQAIESAQFFVSSLTFQELAFVLAKLKLNKEDIQENLSFFMHFFKETYSKKEIIRAFEIAEKTSFRNINDCIHTAIAEKHSTELITFNKKDFSVIEKHTNLKIRIL